MKNRIPFAALTFAFTVAGATLGRSIADLETLVPAIVLIAVVGAFAAAVSGDQV